MVLDENTRIENLIEEIRECEHKVKVDSELLQWSLCRRRFFMIQ